MNLIAPITDYTKFQSMAIWIVSIIVVAFGFKYVTDIISFVLMELYKIFIQENTF